MAPPKPPLTGPVSDTLPEKAHLWMVRKLPAPLLRMAPPSPPAPLLVTAQRISVRLPRLEKAPPWPPGLAPRVKVMSLICTPEPAAMLRMVDVFAASTVTLSAPGPLMTKVLPDTAGSAPVVRVIVLGVAKNVESNTIRPPFVTSVIAWRREPEPVSLLLLTMIAAGVVKVETGVV